MDKRHLQNMKLIAHDAYIGLLTGELLGGGPATCLILSVYSKYITQVNDNAARILSLDIGQKDNSEHFNKAWAILHELTDSTHNITRT